MRTDGLIEYELAKQLKEAGLQPSNYYEGRYYMSDQYVVNAKDIDLNKE